MNNNSNKNIMGSLPLVATGRYRSLCELKTRETQSMRCLSKREKSISIVSHFTSPACQALAGAWLTIVLTGRQIPQLSFQLFLQSACRRKQLFPCLDWGIGERRKSLHLSTCKTWFYSSLKAHGLPEKINVCGEFSLHNSLEIMHGNGKKCCKVPRVSHVRCNSIP